MFVITDKVCIFAFAFVQEMQMTSLNFPTWEFRYFTSVRLAHLQRFLFYTTDLNSSLDAKQDDGTSPVMALAMKSYTRNWGAHTPRG
nr:MAG TPA: hypothetical protein [Caudoviricetes sp.]